MSSAKVESFYRDVYAKRATFSIVFATVVQPLFLAVLLLVSHLDVTDPLSLLRALTLQLRPSSWIYGIGITFCLILLAGFLVVDYTVVPTFHTTRWKILCSLLVPRKWAAAIAYSFAGGLAVRCYLGIAGSKYGSLSYTCSDNLCINEQHFFVVTAGAFIGFTCFVRDYLQNGNYIRFPLVERGRLEWFRNELPQMAWQAVLFTLGSLKWFCLLYFWKGGAFRDYLRRLLRLQLETTPVDSVLGLADIQMLLATTMWCSFFVFGSLLVKLCFQTCVTEQVYFPMKTEFQSDETLYLHEALAVDQTSLLKHMAFRDLAGLCHSNPERRREVYVLSQPGGHPHRWNEISKECLAVIRAAISELTSAAKPATPSAKVAPPVHVPPVQSPILQESARSPGGLQPRERITSLQYVQHPVPLSIRPLFKEKMDKFTSYIATKPAFSFVFGDLPDARAASTFGKSLTVRWAVEALSHLIASSYREDRYGVVQKDVPEVVSTLLQLQQAVENYKRAKPATTGTSASVDVQLQNGLRSAIKSGVYRITVTFGSHLSDLSLPKEHAQQLRQYIQFKEG